MPQLTLFDSRETVLADDERGRISYTPRFVDADIAEAWFAELRTGVEWRAERRVMYDREVDVPRLIGQFRLDPPALAESEPFGAARPAPGVTPAAILAALRRVVDRVG